MSIIDRMKLIRWISFLIIALSVLFSNLALNSCNRDKCKDVICAAGRECWDGFCICPAGYEGENCDTVSRTKIIGNYFVGENCPTSGSQNYYSQITEGYQIEQVEISNIANSGLFCTANISENSILIPSQAVGGMQIEGQGSFNPQLNQITLYMDYNISGTLKQCSLTMVKQ